MERAARLIKKDRRSQQIIGDDDIVRGIWPTAVGKAIARHTVRLKVVRTTLVVEVEDAMWQKQLFPLGNQIVQRVQKLLGNTGIQDVEFRIAIMKRQMQREELVNPASTGAGPLYDEADQILDPVLKKVYRNSRKRETA
jgi:predicted nucleic acid-binding Zn ribbon protein